MKNKRQKSKLHSVHTLTPDKLKVELRLVDQVVDAGTDRGAMNFRHAAAHALVVWYLMLPPLIPGPENRKFAKTGSWG